MGPKDNVADSDQLKFQIREKVIERARMVFRLNDLENYNLYRRNYGIARKMDILRHLHLALDNFSCANKPHKGRAIKSCTTEELDNKKLNYMMLHGTRNLIEEKKLLRNKNMCHKTDDASSSRLLELMKNVQMKYSSYNHHCKQKNCDKLHKEIKRFEVTRKKSAQLKQGIRNHVKIMSDELMEMRKKKHALETKIKHVNREIEVINEEIIRSFQKHLKGRFCRNDAYLFMLQEMKNKGYWVLNSIDLGYDQAFGFRDIYSKKFLCYNISTLNDDDLSCNKDFSK
ncbi:hypothetical protein AAZX31_01G090300 [Glycine max]|uniref:Uncharacterized protein n=2 Tax=Glycine subgen. Soja TaxID=1462606 RepID=K7K2W5_SOYBN|nr:uncharacterized protein LOC102669268 isoform X1 [Glycine max]XP_006573302.1 uncharacterized protein LOC102669268 isoform X1 [Glycine max]XP_028234932.1 uncharacterized protein LOC114414742 isoform X1 [Glycine soja]XP_028234940.1 uncharacterized protein LOC114414742 isoform X1 [Glycine soja]KAG5060115.1 hypothetical protein JHK87_001144 [Glycine soja]KAH1162405.1 hypothetical protein GYH30_001058 [Glycine max]KAH1162408.1 hypothetical protein GYH30_001058 [Glycine max]KAH1162412.1 hypothet|eukprot:XP_006573301.1 uncharacterized protein LOC102669268 isoform X1 [Glycine max]